MLQYKRIIDISQPVQSNSARFPGDTAYKREIVLSHAESKVVNLTSFSMSPHIGTHVDAPAHIKGEISAGAELVGQLPLSAFLGPALVVDLAPQKDAISWSEIKSRLDRLEELIRQASWLNAGSKTISGDNPLTNANDASLKMTPRILFRTMEKIRYDVFEEEYAHFSTELIEKLARLGVELMGIDSPSADHINSKTLECHHKLDSHKMNWLENLDLTNVSEGVYYLIALPIKFMELEASPVRAVLLEF